MIISHLIRRFARLVPRSGAIALACTLILGCSEQPEADGPNTTRQEEQSTGAVNEYSYTVKGIITQLPEPGPPPKDLKIQHEHIPDFVGKSGDIFMNRDGTPGMRAMVMPFPTLAKDISLEHFQIADKVEFAFTVTWHTTATGDKVPTLVVTQMTKLNDDVEVSFENKTGP